MSILIIEDEEKVLKFLKKGFQEQYFCVDTASNGQEGYFLAKNNPYDCLILDIALPHMNGFDVAKKLRQDQNFTPIIFLTAKDAIQDRITGFDLGGDDYLIKPFAFSELLARVKSLIRRHTKPRPTQFIIGNLQIDTAKRKIYKNALEIELTPKEFSLLQFFLDRKGEVVTRTMLSETIWGYHFDSMTNVIDVHITNLRKKIEDKQSKKPFIKTIRGIGYVLDDPED